MQTTRARVLAQLAFLAVFALAALASHAHAYAGQQLLEWAANNILAPLGIFALVVAMTAAFFRPEFVQKAIYAIVICALLFFMIRSANSIIGMLQAG